MNDALAIESARPGAGARDRLTSTLFVAALLHGVLILGVTFSALSPPESAETPTLRVTIVSTRADDVTNAEWLAQAASRGGGPQADPARATAPEPARERSAETADGADAANALPGRPVPAADRLTTAARTERAAEQPPDPTERPAEMPRRARAATELPAPASTLALTDRQLTAAGDDAAPPGVATEASPVAAYLARWRARVERVGTANFPAAVGGTGPDGNPVLEVAIGADGRLEDIVLRRSSGLSVLDQSALAILRMAAPFEPFPDALREQHDVLRFAYEWQFTAEEPGPTAVLE